MPRTDTPRRLGDCSKLPKSPTVFFWVLGLGFRVSGGCRGRKRDVKLSLKIRLFVLPPLQFCKNG